MDFQILIYIRDLSPQLDMVVSNSIYSDRETKFHLYDVKREWFVHQCANYSSQKHTNARVRAPTHTQTQT